MDLRIQVSVQVEELSLVVTDGVGINPELSFNERKPSVVSRSASEFFGIREAGFRATEEPLFQHRDLALQSCDLIHQLLSGDRIHD